MNDKQIERILKNTKFTMEMEGFVIDKKQEAVGRKVLTGEIKLSDYIEEVKKEAWSFSHEV